MRDRHLEAIFTGYEFTFKFRDLFELILPHLIELDNHVCLERVFFLFTHCLSLGAIFDFRIDKHCTFHTLNF